MQAISYLFSKFFTAKKNAFSFYDMREAAKYLNLTQKQILEMVSLGKLEEFKFDNIPMFRVEHIEELKSSGEMLCSFKDAAEMLSLNEQDVKSLASAKLIKVNKEDEMCYTLQIKDIAKQNIWNYLDEWLDASLTTKSFEYLEESLGKIITLTDSKVKNRRIINLERIKRVSNKRMRKLENHAIRLKHKHKKIVFLSSVLSILSAACFGSNFVLVVNKTVLNSFGAALGVLGSVATSWAVIYAPKEDIKNINEICAEYFVLNNEIMSIQESAYDCSDATLKKQMKGLVAKFEDIHKRYVVINPGNELKS